MARLKTKARPVKAPKTRAKQVKRRKHKPAQALVRFNPQAFLDTVGVGRFIGKYKSGEVIFLQGDPADAVFYIQKGKVQVAVVSKQGKEGVVAVLGAGEFFGEGCLAGQPLHI